MIICTVTERSASGSVPLLDSAGVWGSGVLGGWRVWSWGLRIQGSEFEVWGLGFRV